jgi:hypothetical protein
MKCQQRKIEAMDTNLQQCTEPTESKSTELFKGQQQYSNMDPAKSKYIELCL